MKVFNCCLLSSASKLILLSCIGLNKSDAIGDSGSRSFYLRKSSSARSSNASLNPDDLPDNAGSHLPGSSVVCFQSFIVRKINKIVRRTHKLWKLLGCINCSS